MKLEDAIKSLSDIKCTSIEDKMKVLDILHNNGLWAHKITENIGMTIHLFTPNSTGEKPYYAISDNETGFEAIPAKIFIEQNPLP